MPLVSQRCCTYFLMIIIFLLIVAGYTPVYAAGLIELDSATRRSIRESEVDRYGTKSMLGNSNNQNSVSREPGVVINNSTNATGEKKCTVRVGDVKTIQNTKGIRQENITYVDGSVINVCE